MPTRKANGVVVDVIPSVKRSAEVAISVSKSVPTGDGCLGVPVGVDGPVPQSLGVDRSTLAAMGFEGKVGQTLALPGRGGPNLVAVGTGSAAEVDAAKLRDAAAAFARAAGKHAHLITTLADIARVRPDVAGQVVVEGILLARYRYEALEQASGTALAKITLVSTPRRLDTVTKGAKRGRITAAAAELARD